MCLFQLKNNWLWGFGGLFFFRRLERNFKQWFLIFLNNNNFKHIPRQSNYYRPIFQCVTLSSTHFSGSALKASKYDLDIKHMEPLGKIVTKSERMEGTKRFWGTHIQVCGLILIYQRDNDSGCKLNSLQSSHFKPYQCQACT